MYIFLMTLMAVVALVFFIKNLFQLILGVQNLNTYSRRLKQLEFGSKNEMPAHQIIAKIATPIEKIFYLQKIVPNMDKIEKKLIFSKWNAFFKKPLHYVIINVLLKILGLFLFLLLFNKSLFLALIWLLFPFIGMDILLKNTISQKKEKLLTDFPDMLRIVEGYISADIPFVTAIEKTIKYVCPEWQEILNEFVLEARINNMYSALDKFKNLDIFEIKEFVSITKLVLEQGGDAKKSLSKQANKIQEIQKTIIAIKIGKRNTLATIIQGPILLGCFITFGLPVFNSLSSFSTI